MWYVILADICQAGHEALATLQSLSNIMPTSNDVIKDTTVLLSKFPLIDLSDINWLMRAILSPIDLDASANEKLSQEIEVVEEVTSQILLPMPDKF